MPYSIDETKFTFNVPYGSANSIAAAIRANPIEHPRRQGVCSIGATSDLDFIRVVFPQPEPPKPSIPELIAEWHGQPTPENRKALLAALIDHKRAYFYGETCYFANNRHGVMVIEVY